MLDQSLAAEDEHSAYVVPIFGSLGNWGAFPLNFHKFFFSYGKELTKESQCGRQAEENAKWNSILYIF